MLTTKRSVYSYNTSKSFTYSLQNIAQISFLSCKCVHQTRTIQEKIIYLQFHRIIIQSLFFCRVVEFFRIIHVLCFFLELYYVYLILNIYISLKLTLDKRHHHPDKQYNTTKTQYTNLGTRYKTKINIIYHILSTKIKEICIYNTERTL